MLKLLLDTHTLLWALYQPDRLSARARDLIAEPKNVRLISAATAWEIATKYRLGKLPMAKPLIENYADHLKRFQANELAIDSQQSLLAGTFEQSHRDPFDRLLVAASLLEGVPLITIDSAFKDFPIQVIW